jgi:transposase
VISKELEAKILRLHHAEKWPRGTIARHLQIHHTTVERVLREGSAPELEQTHRPSLVDAYVPFIVEQLKQHPALRASRLYQMVRERGYPGKSDHFRKLVARYRPRTVAEAYHRLRTLPGEQAQVDWGDFGQVEIGTAKRRLWAFVMVLSWSRHIFLRFFYGAAMANFLRGHVFAFEAFGGVPRVILYDNLKSAVIARVGTAIHFNDRQLELSAHYRFEPRPVAPARGNEKGRVERAIRYIRDSFFEARRWRDHDDLNHQAATWVAQIAAARKCPDDRTRTVGEAFEEERGKLLPLPGDSFPSDDVVEVHIGKTPYARFDLNDYSVPAEYARRTLVARATLDTVRIFDGAKLVAEHPRCWDRGQQLEDQQHIDALTAIKQKARRHRGMDRLEHAAPSSRRFLELSVEQGRNAGSVTYRLLNVLDAAGAADTEAAIAAALEAGTIHVGAVRQLVDRFRASRGKPLPVTARLINDRHAGYVVQPHALSGYDAISEEDYDALF